MMTRAKYDKAIDDAFGMHVGAAFYVLVQSISNGAAVDTKEVAVKKFTATARSCIEAHGLAISSAPAELAPRK